jgi:hypothetical protein
VLIYCVTDTKFKMPEGVPVNTLITYFGLSDKTVSLARVKRAKGWRNLFLDCGAFAADNARKQIDLDAYSRYCKENEAAIDVYVALDVRGRMKQSIENYHYMKAEYGLKPVPVFPILSGDPDEWKHLEALLEEADYVALGNMVGRPWPKTVLKAHLDKVFAINADYRRRIHSFGYTARWALVRYPFYSVDTARWLQETAWWRYHLMDRSTGKLRIRQLRKVPESMRDMEASRGLREVPKRDRMEQISRSALAMHDYGAWLTEVWAARGIVWHDDAHRRAYPELMSEIKEVGRDGTR